MPTKPRTPDITIKTHRQTFDLRFRFGRWYVKWPVVMQQPVPSYGALSSAMDAIAEYLCITERF